MDFEKSIYSKAQNSTVIENSDQYVDELNQIIDEKLFLYMRLREKLEMFQNAAKEEEEFYSNYTRKIIR